MDAVGPDRLDPAIPDEPGAPFVAAVCLCLACTVAFFAWLLLAAPP